jgi:HEAT repeat protein
LIKILLNDAGDIRYWAAKALGTTKSKEALLALEETLESDNTWLKKYSSEAIKEIKSRYNQDKDN